MIKSIFHVAIAISAIFIGLRIGDDVRRRYVASVSTAPGTPPGSMSVAQ